MNLRHAAALALVFPVLAAFSCGSQSHQQEVQEWIPVAKPPKPRTAECVGGCHIYELYDQAPGCYVGSIPEMKSYATPPAVHAATGNSFKEGPPFPEVMAELCIESDNLGVELWKVNVTTSSREWNSFFDANPLHLSMGTFGPTFSLITEGYLGGVATWLDLEWRCKTTIPDHKRLLCVHSWMRHTGLELDVGPDFRGRSDQKIMYYLVRSY